MFSDKFRLCLCHLNCAVKVWRRHREVRILQKLGAERMEWQSCPQPHSTLVRSVWLCSDQTTSMDDLQQVLAEQCDAIPQQCLTKLVSGMRRRCQVVSSDFSHPLNEISEIRARMK